MITELREVKMNTPKTDEPESLLSIQDLHVWYELRRFGFGHAGYVKAVDGVSFDMEEGETVAVVGESGCGKSSLMKTILGLNIPTSGDVIFDGENLSGLKGHGLSRFRFKIGYVQQDPYGALPPFMDVLKILEEPLIISGMKNKEERLARIHKVMGEVKMHPVDDFLQKFPHMLSGGQQQRIVIAMALLSKPALLLLDEPTEGLAPKLVAEVGDALVRLRESGLSLLLVEQNLALATRVAQRVYVMNKGTIVFSGTTAELAAAGDVEARYLGV